MKTWEKILLYPIGLYLWLTDGIKNVSKKWKPAMAMLMAVVMLCGMLPATAMAASTAKVKVGGISLVDGQCLTGNGATAATTWAEGDDYVALYKAGVLYINNLEISGEGAAISFQGSMDLIVDVSGENTLVRTDGTCIDITSYTYGLVIQGSGTLTATGSGFGIWVRENVTIQGDVTLTVEGTSDAGIASNRGNTGLSDTSITIKDNAFVTATGGKHGLGGDHDRTPRVVVEGNATVVAKGGTYAIRKLTADTVSSQRVLASTDITGSNKEEYVADNNSTYKYVEVNYGTGIAYLDSTGTKQYCDEYTSVDGSTTWNTGWYYVNSDITFTDRITVSGNVSLILGDGATLSATKGITVETDNSLTIYAQSTGENMGKLVAGSQSENAAIGGASAAGGNITINGGDIQATGGYSAAGIGGGYYHDGGNIVIKGGTVTAIGGDYAAGIGGGAFADGGNITISGGTVTANGGPAAAGIGGGGGGNGGNITISGGIVNATGGKWGAGIGGGTNMGADIIVVYTSDPNRVKATAGSDADNYGDGKVSYNCYQVTFDSNGGSGDMGFLYISKNYTYAFPECRFTAPDGKQFKAWDIGGTEFAPGANLKVTENTTVTAIWENIPAAKHTVSFAANGGSGSMTPVEVEDGTEYTLPACTFTAPENKEFKAWSVGGEEKQPGDKVVFMEDATVTAIWEDISHTCSIEPVEKVWPDCDNGGKEAYYKCEGCGKSFEDANGTTEIADIATWGNLPKNGHTEGAVWEKDATHHWHICTVAGCGAVIDSSKEAHSSTGTNVATCQSKAVCDDCGATYGDFAGHDWNTASWEKDATGHWHKCNTAGCTEKNAFAAHTPDRAAATETDPVKCSVCGYEITPALGHTHTHGTEWKSDKDNHWNECACGDKANTAAHKDENADGKCDVCAYNIGLPTTPDDDNKPSDNPQTGDNTQLGLWIALLIVSSFGIVAITLFGKKKYSAR